jgi:hypothetical protein
VAAAESPSFRPFSRVRPTRPPAGIVFAVGQRVVVVCPTGRADRVPLTATDGTSPRGVLTTGTEVEIVAWQPHRAGGARYCVAARGGVEGWLPAVHLRAVPRAAPAKVVVKVVAPPPSSPPSARTRKPAVAMVRGGPKAPPRRAKRGKA